MSRRDDYQDAVGDQSDGGEGLDETGSPPDHLEGLERRTTPRELAEGESLDERLKREAGEGLSPGRRIGRLVDDGSQDVDDVDETPELIAEEEGLDSGDFSAEEAAMHEE
ncbi:MAG: DUF5709 domain-containing protein [Actinomycetota bacterium]